MFCFIAFAVVMGGIVYLGIAISWWLAVAAFVLWLVGASCTTQMISQAGRRNPSTIGDCFTGDYDLDGVCVVWWPLLGLVHIGQRLAGAVS